MLRLAAIATALMLSVPAWAQDLKGVALVIGESKYETLTELVNPNQDARDIDDLLNDLGFEVERVLNADAEELREAILAYKVSRKYSKDQILALYLNEVYYGNNAYGVEAASRRYFNKSARDVNLGEAALLAGLLKAPSRLSPARDPQAAEERAQVVLHSMQDVGFITEDEIKTAMSQPPTKAKRFWSGRR